MKLIFGNSGRREKITTTKLCNKMRHYEYFMKLVLMWHVTKILKTHGEVLSKENPFSIQKYPAVPTTDAENIKNNPKICYEHNTRNHIAYYSNSNSNNNNTNNNDTSNIVNIFKNILKYFHEIDCTENEQRNLDVWNLPAEHRQLETGVQDIEDEENMEEYDRGDQYEKQQFSILQQLKLDEQKEKWKEKQKTQQQQQQNALKFQQLSELQQIMQHFESQALGKAGKKKKKKKKKKKRKKKKPKDKQKKRKKKPIVQPLLTQPAHILYASPTQKPQYYHHPHKVPATTKKPFYQHELVPLKKLKYILRKNTIFKKKKKEYLNHLKHVIYPFVKFIAFFTIINPFTLAVFLFALISPVVFGFLGFIALSFLIKPALHLLFGVKHTVSQIKHKKWLEQRKRQRLRDSHRPITIHKHYYQQRPIAPPSHKKHSHHHHSPPPRPPPKIAHHFTQYQPLLQSSSPHNHQHYPRNRHIHGNQRPGQVKWFNPLLPHEKEKLKKDTHFLNDYEDYKETYN